MGTQTPRQQSNELQGYNLALPARLVIATMLLLFVMTGITVGVLNSLRFATLLPIILSLVFAVLSVMFLLLQRFLPLSYTPLNTRAVPTQVFGSFPFIDSRIIQQREDTVKDIYTRLSQAHLSAVVLTGIGGVGKSILAALLYRYAEEQRRASNGPFITEALWIRVDDAFTITELAKILFGASGLSVPDFTSVSPADQAAKILNMLNDPERTRLIVLDQFENLLDEQTGQVLHNQSGISEWIALLNEQNCASRVLIASRFWTQKTFDSSTNHVQEFHCKGLEMIDGVKLLQKLEAKGSEERRRAAVVRSGGHPLALVLLASFLRNYKASLTAFSKDPILIKLWVREVGYYCFASLYEQHLYPMQRKLLLAFSVYREAVPLEAAEDIIDFDNELTRKQVKPALEVLLMHHLLKEPEEERYQLHPLVAAYIQDHFVEDDTLANEQSLKVAHTKAVEYYRQHAGVYRPSKDKRESATDVHPYIEIVWHLCHAHQYKEAYRLMQQENIFPVLKRWGRNKTLLSLYQAMLPLDKWHPTPAERVEIYHNLGRVYSELGHNTEAKKYLEQALSIVRETKEHGGERGKILADLGRACSALGDKRDAQKHLEDALDIVRRVKDREEEGKVLNILSLVYDDLGRRDQAKTYLDQALRINQEIANLSEQSRTFDNLGLLYSDSGEKERALAYYQRALKMREDLGDRRGEAVTLKNLGRVYADLGNYKDAREKYEQAINILREVGNLREEARTLDYLGQVYADLGQYDEALEHYWWALNTLREVEDRWEESKTLNHMVRVYQIRGQKEEARQCFEAALALSRKTGDRREEGRILNSLVRMHDDQHQTEEVQKDLEHALVISREAGDLKGEGLTQHNLGRIYYDLGKEEEAHAHFKRAYHIRKKAGDSRGVAWTLRNIGELYHKQRHLDAALASLLAARQIFDDVQSPDREEAQKAIDSLREDIGRQRFNELSKRVTPQADQIVRKVLKEEAE